MNKLLFGFTIYILLSSANKLQAQELHFNRVIKNNLASSSDFVQDKLGIFWVPTFERGLIRYDGINTSYVVNDPANPNSVVSSPLITISVDEENMIWIGSLGKGLDKFDPASNNFTHFRHKPSDPFSLSSDTVICLLEDHLHNLWVGTSNGLNLLDKKTGKFTRFKNITGDPSSISYNIIFKLYEDRKGILWMKTEKHLDNTLGLGSALNKFDRVTKKFTRYEQNVKNVNSPIPGKSISDMYEDRNGIFWISTYEGELYTLDRTTIKCTRYYLDPLHSNILSKTPINGTLNPSISFMKEDVSGAFWIGFYDAGLMRFDPISKKSTHFGKIFTNNKLLSAKDTLTGFFDNAAMKGIKTKDGLFWVLSGGGDLYNLNYHQTKIPFITLENKGANAFFVEPNGNALWIATDKGLMRQDVKTKSEKIWTSNPKDKNSLIDNNISTMRVDEQGKLWLGTSKGLDKFEPLTEKYTHYIHDSLNNSSLLGNRISYLFFDHNKTLWVASDLGISKMDKTKGTFINYKPEGTIDVIFPGNFLCIVEDHEYNIWISSGNGAYKLDIKTGKFRKYLSGSFLKSLCVDAKGILWAGGTDALYFYNKTKDDFVLFANQQSPVTISAVINIIEDNLRNLWVSTSISIIKISADRKRIKKYDEMNGVRYTNFIFNDNYKAPDGRLYLGIGGGYYSFLPQQINDTNIAPQLQIIGFTLGNTKIQTKPGGILTSPIWQSKEIHIKHNQNAFSFEFFATDYIHPGDEKYLFMLENYDDTWHDIGSDRRASFFNVPPGEYIFKVKVVNGDGEMSEKSLQIIISPPWWRTWWAYLLYALLILFLGYLAYKYQKHYIIKRERERTEQKELQQAREIEKAYKELKITQAQLIQSEKMASLGELTAGIAHEIQNPLNFVNNFSEVNKELLIELKDEMKNGNLNEVSALIDDVINNEEKINFHGKRADSIVKGMLQHSRSSNGQKEASNINVLADEYLRLAYHGLRAKDKSFNVGMQTNFDESIGLIQLVPQDIGRVILNLVTNAFYAVDEKRKLNLSNYEPLVSISTIKKNGSVVISVKDNGNGIPQKVLDKIFQPFFTTKPTGQGTGLGLSMSYDIIKVHGGELRVETKEGEGAEFIIELPIG